MSTQTYPGGLAAPAELIRLADEYRRAAQVLLNAGRGRKPISRAHFRLSALHAIELYLNAVLLDRGYAATQVRGMQHDFARRTRAALAAGLVLRTRTAEHLIQLSTTREYLMTRYAPDAVALSQINRLEVTLEEVGTKVTALVARASAPVKGVQISAAPAL